MSRLGLTAAAGATAAEDSDEFFENTTLLLHGDGTNGAQNNTFLDSSTNGLTLTRVSTPTQGSFSPFSKPDGRWGNYFAGTAAFSTPLTSAFQLGAPSGNTNDFTVEFFLYQNNTAIAIPLGTGYGVNAFWGFGVNRNSSTGANEPGLLIFALTDSFTLQAQNAFTANAWYHIAAVRTGTTVSMYVNGTRVATATSSVNPNPSSPFWVGGDGSNLGRYMNGYISNLRIVRGSTQPYDATASSITVPTTELTAVTGTTFLSCQSNRFVDNSTNNATITSHSSISVTPFSPFPITTAYDPAVNGGSGYFDGTDYLTIPSNNAFLPRTGDFTIDGWVYPTSANDGQLIWGQTVSGNNYFVVFAEGTNKRIIFIINNTNVTTANGTLQINQWNYFTVTRSSGTITASVNGQSGTPVVNTTDVNQNYVPTIGRYTHAATNFFFGYMANLRFVNGSSIAHSVPSSLNTVVSNTSALLNFTNAGIFDNTGFNNLETVGKAQIDTTTKQFGTGSLDFAANDGTAYLLLPASDNTALGGDFTVEFWLNPDTVTTSYADSNLATLLDTDASTGIGTEWWVIHQVNNTLQFGHNGSIRLTSDAELAATTWQHCAIVRNGSTLTWYIDGVAEGSTTYSTVINGSRKLYIAKQPGASRFYKGYIDDIRITKGIARYTANFDPPTKAFPNIG